MTVVNQVGNALTGSTGTGAFVGANTPTLITPLLGTPTSGNLVNCTGYPAGSISGQVLLANGGTSANLTASNGGIFYSTASAGAILSGTATAGKMLQSGATAAPTWSTPTYPSASGTAGKILRADGTNNVYSTATFADTYTASNLLYSNGANTITGLATANSSVLVTNSSGVPSLSTTLPSGISATNMSLITPTIKDSAGNAVVTFGNNGGNPGVNYFQMLNSATLNSLVLQALGTDSNINILFQPKGSGQFIFYGSTSNSPMTMYSGTASQHQTTFTFVDTAASRTVTFPDTSGTVTMLGNTSTGSGSVVLATSPTLTTPVLGVASATSINFGGSTLSTYVQSTSFTPGISIGGSTTGITYTTQNGIYSRIGNVVNFSIYIVLSSKGGLTGALLVTGLPIVTQSSITVVTTFAISVSNITFAASNIIRANNNPGNTSIGIFVETSNAALAAVDGGSVGNTAVINITGSYHV